jgi:hypothetical protein
MPTPARQDEPGAQCELETVILAGASRDRRCQKRKR